MEKHSEIVRREEDGDMDSIETKWSEKVEDLVEEGATEEAIALLETVVSKLQVNETASATAQLAAALSELSALYNSNYLSLKADTLLSRAALLTATQHQSVRKPSENGVSVCGESTIAGESHFLIVYFFNSNSARILDVFICMLIRNIYNMIDYVADVDDLAGLGEESTNKPDIVSSPRNADSDDDWEAIADRPDEELLPSQSSSREPNHSPEDIKVEAPKRRGRGTFSYDKNKMYSDQQFEPTAGDSDDEDASATTEGRKNSNQPNYGPRHVLVLADFSPTLRTMDLEKLFANFTDRGVSIRWINDTTALAVFSNPSAALEAQNKVQCSFTVRVLEDDDALLGCIPIKDLEPPRQRPKTCARTAQRLIAHGMGLKLPSTFRSRESKEEAARRNRIVTRQKLRDDAWGDS
ncbi:uncharacterized protein [Rutidosis leptorrhynchoides]|uniref:uncharacterized protein n=1 Tax=Rutidosis leptorrhynchoides TaxID=125765 RepID=UPI003A99257B